MAVLNDAFRVLFVCTGNICRSPIAEQVFRARLGSPAVVFSSAGTDALVGEWMPPQAIAVSRALKAYPDGHVAKQLFPSTVESADLVLAMTRRQRSVVARMVPRASRYSFTLREFARLADLLAADPALVPGGEPGQSLPSRLRAVLPILASHRGLVATQVTADDDVPDPYRKGDSAFRLVGEIIDDAASRVVTAVSAVVAREV